MLPVVLLDLVHPALTDERHVADDARRGEPRQVAHDRVLQVLSLGQRQPPVLAERDHVAHVEVVRRDRRVVLQRERQVEQILRGVVDPAQQHALVADVEQARIHQCPSRLGHQRGDRVDVVDVGVDRDMDPTRVCLGGDPTDALDDVGGSPVLRQSHERLGRQADVADVVDLQEPVEEGLEVLPRQVGDVAAGDHDIAHRRGRGEVVEHRLVAVDRLHPELELGHLRRGVADEVHPGAVPAILRAGRQQLGQHLGRVAVGQAFDGPHVVLVQRVARRLGVARPVGAPVGEDGEHVAPDRVAIVGGRVCRARGRHTEVAVARGWDHRVEHLRRDEHRHRRPLVLVALEVGVEVIGEQVTHELMQLLDGLHAVAALPLGIAPLGLGDVAPAGQASPVGLDQGTHAVGVGLFQNGRHASKIQEDLRC
ncbi:MAG: hypothetical protein BWY91_00752 [bacterium ADurb.BinA028]|nr:MAG: hypothetical protein BWY91_00752 [bacterium ADurb.BinA028]